MTISFSIGPTNTQNLSVHIDEYQEGHDSLEKIQTLVNSWKDLVKNSGLKTDGLRYFDCSLDYGDNKQHILTRPVKDLFADEPSYSIRCSIQKIEAIAKVATNPKESHFSLTINGRRINNNQEFKYTMAVYHNGLGTVTYTG